MGLTHKDVLTDSDAVCIIDTVTRKIQNQSGKNAILQYDHNSEKISFVMDRHIDGHDMYLVDRIAIKYLNVKNADMYIVDDLGLSKDGTQITFSWLISGNATQEAGSLVFLINFRCYNDSGDLTYNWSTQPCSTYSIAKGVTSMDSNPKELYDFWAKYKKLVDETSQNGEDLEEKLDSLTETTDSLTSAVSNLTDVKSQMTTLTKTGNKLEVQLKSTKAKVDELLELVSELEDQVDTLDRTLADDQVLAINESITELKQTIGETKIFIDSDLWEMGGYTDGKPITETNKRVCIKPLSIIGKTVSITLGEGYNGTILEFESDGTTLVTDHGWKTGTFTVDVVLEHMYAFQAKRLDDTEIDITEADFQQVYYESLLIARDDSLDERIAILEERISDYLLKEDAGDMTIVLSDDLWEMGGYSSGELSENTNRIRVRPMRIIGKTVSITFGDGYTGTILEYETDGVTLIKDHGWRTGTYTVDINLSYLYAFQVRRKDATDMDISEKQYHSITYELLPARNIVDLYNKTEALADVKSKVEKMEGVNANEFVIDTFKAIAHRGSYFTGPQGTEPAFVLSRQYGFKYAENDLRITKDGVYVMWHDPTLAAVNRSEYGVEYYTYEELLSMDFGVWKNKVYEGTKILTFEEWILLCKKLGQHAYIDFKVSVGDIIDDLMSIVRKYGMLRSVTWLAYGLGSCRAIRAVDPYARLAVMATPSEENNAYFSELQIPGREDLTFYNVDQSLLTAENAQIALDGGYGLEVWWHNLVADDAVARAKELLEWGVQGMTLNDINVSHELYMEYTNQK